MKLTAGLGIRPRAGSRHRLLRCLTIFGLTSLIPCPLSAQQTQLRRVYLVGDSTVANQKEDQPIRGWGQYLQPYFKGTIRVCNRAVSGRSSKSFQREGFWRDVLREKPDFVFVQFGHNDATRSEENIHTLPNSDFRECINRYVDSARQIGAEPILVTPIRTRTFVSGQLIDSLGPYAEVIRNVAAKRNVPLVDLYSLTTDFFQRLGEDRCAQFASGKADDTHFNELGAKVIAELVVRELRRLKTPLSQDLLNGFSILAPP